MTVDTIVYEKGTEFTSIALMNSGRLEEIDIIDNSKAAEGNIYLGKITHKLDLANGRKGYLVDIKDEKDAFFNADEYGMGDVEYTEGQSIVAQVVQERRAEKGAKIVRSLQFVGTYLVYCPFRMNIDASSRIGSFERIKELKALVQDNVVGQEGWIIRTAASEALPEEICEEMVELRKAYDIVRAKARSETAPCLLYAKSSPLFEYMTNNAMSLNKVVVNTRNMEEEIDNSLQYVLENINRALGKTILISAKDKNRSQDEQAIREIIDCNELYLQKYDNFLDEVSELKREPLKDTTELDARIKSLETFRMMNGG